MNQGSIKPYRFFGYSFNQLTSGIISQGKLAQIDQQKHLCHQIYDHMYYLLQYNINLLTTTIILKVRCFEGCTITAKILSERQEKLEQLTLY